MRRADAGKRRINKRNIIVCLVIIPAIFFLGLGFARAGDMFLAFIGREMHVDIDYKNRSGFVSCFLLRAIRLQNPVFTLKDSAFALECQNAIIQPGFDRLRKKRQIILDCYLEQGAMPLPFGGLDRFVFPDIYAKLIIYGETVEFPYCLASAEGVKLHASGYVSESGDFEIKMKIFFSTQAADELPEEFRALLTEESGGWVSHYFHAKSGQDKSSYKFETDRFSIDFERLEVK